ncbi:MAG: hypothetical protein KY475_12835, partial [Planctomycetes bacterium]|nr:hypothetical protein [Planctomycetota bacterium]
VAEFAVRHVPTVAAWRLYLTTLDAETTETRTANACFHDERARRRMAKELRKGIKAYREWQKEAQSTDGSLALWCWDRKWQEEGHLEDVVRQKYGEDWKFLGPAKREREIRRRYFERKNVLEGLKGAFEPHPDLFIALAWHETQHQRLLALPENLPRGAKDRGVFNTTPVIDIFREARRQLPDDWRWTAFEAQFFRYIWEHRQSVESYRDAIRMAPRVEERNRLKAELAEVLLTAAIFTEAEEEGNQLSERVQWLEEAFDCVSDLQQFERTCRAAALLKDRIAFELGKPVDWNRLDQTYNLVFKDDDYINSIITHLPVLRQDCADVSVELAQAVKQYFTDSEVLRSFGSLYLRRSGREPTSGDAVMYARRAYATFNACRILEEGKSRTRDELATTRFQRARAILTAVERSGDASPFDVGAGKKYESNLSYAQALFQSVSARSVNAFRRAASNFTKRCQQIRNQTRCP